MNLPLHLRVSPHSSEMYESLGRTHFAEKHAFFRIDPSVSAGNGEVVIDAYMPQEEHYRKGQRAGFAIRRLLEAGVPFSLEVRGMTEARSLPEYQLWTMSDWVRGQVGSATGESHFYSKALEEYVELQDEIFDNGDGLAGEFGDLLFCISATASNAGLILGDHVNEQLNLALPKYAKRTTAKPLRFRELEDLVNKYPKLTVMFARSDNKMAEFLDNVPKTFVDTSQGLQQPTEQQSMRMRRLFVSEVLRCLTESKLLLEDTEVDELEMDHAKDRSGELLTRSFLLTLLVAYDIFKSSDISLDEVVAMNMAKIQKRIENGQPITKV